MAKDDTIVINNPPQRRVSKSGKARYTVDVQSEPLVHVFDPKTLGKQVAEALAEALRKKVLEITAMAPPSTLAARKVAAKAFGEGKSWALKKYGGGKIGPMAPNQSDRAFNDSGRFAKSIVAQPRDEEWRINVAANRLSEATTGGEIGVRRIWNRLVELVPAFGNPAMLFEEQSVKDSVVGSIEGMITKARATREQLTEARAKAALGLIKQAMSLVA